MRARLSMLAGLVVGVAVAGLLLGGLVAFAPEPPPPATPTPSPVVAAPSPSSDASIVPSASPSPSSDASIVPSVSPSASASAAAAPFRVGQPARRLVVLQVGGGTIDGALGGIDPDVMAHGLTTIVSGVDVTP